MPKLSTVRLTKRTVEDARPGEFISDSVLRGFGLRVTPSGTKCFVITYRKENGDQGRQVVGHFPADTVDEARTEAQKRLSGVKGGRDPSKDRKNLRAAPMVQHLADEYLGSYAASRNLRARTVKDARTVLTLALPTLGRCKVLDISTTDIRRAHGEAQKLAGVYQANRLLAVLSKMFSLAEERGWRTGNPCRSVKKFPEDQRWRNLSESEVMRLLGACDGYENQNAADAIRLLLFTGARLQEVLKAEWSQFDLETGLWEKPSAHTKTKRQHRLELDGPALILLREMRVANPHGEFLFPGEPTVTEEGGVAVKARADLKRPWTHIVKEARLDSVCLHDLRRTTASFMLSGGASLATVGKTLGHTQASTTARYAHLAKTVQRDELRKVGEHISDLQSRAREGLVIPMRMETR